MPAASYVGTDTFVYAVSDGIEEVRATVTIEVYNQEPLISYPDFIIAHDTWLVGDLRDHVFDADGDALTFQTVLEPAHADTFYLDADGFLMYLPEPGWTGVDSFVFTVTDGAASADVVAFISVVNEHPWAEDDLLAFDPAESGSLFRFHVSDLLGNDWDPDTPSSRWQLHILPNSGPHHGNLTFDPESGYFSYLVDPSFEGIDSFSYYLTDGIQRTHWSPGVLDDLPITGVDNTFTTSNVGQVTIQVGNPQRQFVNNNNNENVDEQAKETLELVFFTFIPQNEVSIPMPVLGPVRRFKGDGRGFTANPDTETAFRTKQYVRLDFLDDTKSKYRVEQNYAEVGESVEYDWDGSVKARDKAKPNWNTIVKTFTVPGENLYVIHVEMIMSAGNPLVLFSPNIDYHAKLQLYTRNGDDFRSVPLEWWSKHFWVTVDGFPNYEAYVKFYNHMVIGVPGVNEDVKWIEIYTHDHGTETPWALYGNARDYTRGDFHDKWPLKTIGGQP